MAPLTEETTKLRYITPAILKVGWDLENISYEALSDIRSEDTMEMRIPLLPRKHKEYRRTKKLRQLRSLQGLTQRKVTQTDDIDKSTVRDYELARHIPRPEHVRAWRRHRKSCRRPFAKRWESLQRPR